LKNHYFIFFPHPTIRALFVQQEPGERRPNWITGMQEYDLEFKPVHTIKGHGLCRLPIEAVDEKEDDSSSWNQEIEIYNVERASPTSTYNSWYMDVHKYLKHGTFPSRLSTR